jgi:DNA processing protein
MPSASPQTLAYIKLNLALGPASRAAWRLLDFAPHPEKIFDFHADVLRHEAHLNQNQIMNLSDPELHETALREWDQAAREGIQILTPPEPGYPEGLRRLYEAPLAIYVQGTLQNQDPNIAIVGTRRATAIGKRAAREFAHRLASLGITITSGLARGIDTSSHEGALEAGGRTLAVLGCGLTRVYPPENRRLAERIAKSGAVISEYAFSQDPRPQYFPLRNRLISGLSDGVLVVEAPEKSGALITAEVALEEGKDVFAIPGNLYASQSKGTNRLIQEGACCVQAPEDILYYKNWDLVEEPLLKLTRERLTAHEKSLYELCSGDEPKALDELSEATGKQAAHLLSTLSALEMKGLVEALPGHKWYRSNV